MNINKYTIMTNPIIPPNFSKEPLSKTELNKLRASDKKVTRYIQKVDDDSKLPA